MNTEELMASLKEIVKPYVKNEEGFNNMTEETDFLKDLKINSANLIDVILDIETAFDIEIDNASMEKMITVKSALEIIETQLATKGFYSENIHTSRARIHQQFSNTRANGLAALDYERKCLQNLHQAVWRSFFCSAEIKLHHFFRY